MRRFLTTLVFACFSLIMITQTSSAIDPATIAGMWLFDDGSGETARDSSGNGNDGQIFGAQWTEGRFGKGLQFDGSAYVDLGDDESLNLVDNLTLMAWIKHETGNDGYVIMRNDDSDMRQYGFLDYPGNQSSITCFATTGSGRQEFFHGGEAVDDNEWHHIAVVYDNPAVTLYVDGSPKEETGTVKELNGPMLSAETTTLIGRRKPANFSYIGVIDEVAIFNISLSEDDIGQIMSNGLNDVVSAVSPADKLAASWAQVKIQH